MRYGAIPSQVYLQSVLQAAHQPRANDVTFGRVKINDNDKHISIAPSMTFAPANETQGIQTNMVACVRILRSKTNNTTHC
jgi:hypothetical protein